jgi:signal transduction histidine kinase
VLRWLAIALTCAAAMVVARALLDAVGVGLLLVALGLVLAAAVCWRTASLVAASVRESQAWTEVGLLKSQMIRRDALWACLPAAAAAWDAEGQLLTSTAAWHALGLSTDVPPTEPELVVGSAPRVFVVETARTTDGVQLVLLREVTRERQALNAKDELLAILGHELRTPLSSIKGYGQLMARQLATVQEQVQRLDHLIGDVLDTARADAGRLNLRREPLPATDLVSAAADRFRAANPERSLDTRIEGEALVEGDAIRLGQVLDNLLSNAAKYSPPDSTIVVASSLDGNTVRLAVTDFGRGIPSEYVPRLFDRFYRVPAEDAAAPPGFGLGLSIVHDLVEAHHGKIEVVSQGSGKGSTFTVVLPVALALSAQ